MWNRRRMVGHPPPPSPPSQMEWGYEILFDDPKKRGTTGVDGRNMCEPCTHMYIPCFLHQDEKVWSCPVQKEEGKRERGTTSGWTFSTLQHEIVHKFDMLNNGHVLKSFTFPFIEPWFEMRVSCIIHRYHWETPRRHEIYLCVYLHTHFFVHYNYIFGQLRVFH